MSYAARYASPGSVSKTAPSSTSTAFSNPSREVVSESSRSVDSAPCPLVVRMERVVVCRERGDPEAAVVEQPDQVLARRPVVEERLAVDVVRARPPADAEFDGVDADPVEVRGRVVDRSPATLAPAANRPFRRRTA